MNSFRRHQNLAFVIAGLVLPARHGRHHGSVPVGLCRPSRRTRPRGGHRRGGCRGQPGRRVRRHALGDGLVRFLPHSSVREICHHASTGHRNGGQPLRRRSRRDRARRPQSPPSRRSQPKSPTTSGSSTASRSWPSQAPRRAQSLKKRFESSAISSICAACRYESGPPTRPAIQIENDGHVLIAGAVWAVDVMGLPGPELALPVRSGGQTQGRFVLRPTPGYPVTLATPRGRGGDCRSGRCRSQTATSLRLITRVTPPAHAPRSSFLLRRSLSFVAWRPRMVMVRFCFSACIRSGSSGARSTCASL